MTETVSNPIFARVYARVAKDSESRGGAEHRRRMLAGCAGRVIEIGAGVGSNFAYYPSTGHARSSPSSPSRICAPRRQREAAQCRP